jgi:TPR repeat protein
MYENGRGGLAQDDVQAVYWFRKAADQGNAVAQYYLGVAYARGQGVAQDDAQAVFWFRKAAEQGDPDAKAFLNDFAAQSTVVGWGNK